MVQQMKLVFVISEKDHLHLVTISDKLIKYFDHWSSRVPGGYVPFNVKKREADRYIFELLDSFSLFSWNLT